MDKINILMTDDHPVVRAGIRGMLETQSDFDVVAEAENGREAFEQVSKFKPDVVLMDLRMPEMGGVEAIGKI
jgi:YesN/AraC family two-component response regulator